MKKPKKKKGAPEEDEGFVVRWQAPALQADLIVEKLRALNPKMSTIEIGERSIPGKFFQPMGANKYREGICRYCILGETF